MAILHKKEENVPGFRIVNLVFGRSGGLYVAIFLRRVQKGFSLQSLTQNLSSSIALKYRSDQLKTVDISQMLSNDYPCKTF